MLVIELQTLGVGGNRPVITVRDSHAVVERDVGTQLTAPSQSDR